MKTPPTRGNFVILYEDSAGVLRTFAGCEVFASKNEAEASALHAVHGANVPEFQVFVCEVCAVWGNYLATLKDGCPFP